jgi:hypothetical protein
MIVVIVIATWLGAAFIFSAFAGVVWLLEWLGFELGRQVDKAFGVDPLEDLWNLEAREPRRTIR